MRAGIYVRISRDRTGEAGGVRRQEKDCRALAAQLGWEVAGVYSDNDVSAYRRNVRRPEYERLWADVEAGRIDAVVAYHPKRLYRRLTSLEDLVDRAERGGATPIRTVAGGELDLSTATGRAMARIMGALAQMESEELGERVARKKDSLAQEGKHSGSRRPFGYDKHATAVVPEEADEFRRAAAMVLDGASLRSIARRWNEMGLVRAWKYKTEDGGTEQREGSWNPGSVRRVLTSPRYAGLRVHRGEVVGDAKWPPIITKRDYGDLVRLLSDPQRANGSGPRMLLTGLAHCGVEGCGGRLTGRPTNGRAGYICKASGRVHLGVRADPLEELVTRRASDLYLPDPASVADPSELSAPLLADRDAAEAELEGRAAQRARGEISEVSFRGFDRELTRRLAEIDAELARIEERAPRRTYLQTLGEPDDWEAFRSDPSTRAWLETLVERVVVLPGRRGATKFEEDRVEIVLRDGVRERERD